MTETVLSDFAGLMSKAAEAANPPGQEAPYGYTTDPDGTRRPKKSPGRPRKSPTLDELKEAKAAEAASSEGAKQEDRPPDSKRRPHRRRSESGPTEPKPVVQFREGVIAKGINRLYRKAGKMVKVADADIGQALIDITRKDTLDNGQPDPEDVTVGEAWEEIARTNPRIRAFLMKVIAGGAWGQLFMCHAPVLLAILMKDAIRRRLPFQKLVEAFLSPDEDGEAPADGTPLEGLTMPDMSVMRAAAEQFARQMMNGEPPRMPKVVGEHVHVAGDPPCPGCGWPGIPAVPPAFRRQQPKRSSRAERAGTR